MTWFHFRKRKDGSFWLTLLGLSFHGQLCRWRGGVAAVAYWGGGDGQGIGFSLRCIYGLWLTLEIPWRVAKRIPFWPLHDKLETGFAWTHRWANIMLAYNAMGTHYHKRGRFAWFRNAWLNREIKVWDNRWVTGHDRYTSEVLDEREVEIDCGRWPTDRYVATQRIEHATWRNRFRTKTRVSYWWDTKKGIPTDAHGKWGDRYGETSGFGTTAADGLPLESLIALAPAALERRLPSLLSEWPAGMVAEEDGSGGPV